MRNGILVISAIVILAVSGYYGFYARREAGPSVVTDHGSQIVNSVESPVDSEADSPSEPDQIELVTSDPDESDREVEENKSILDIFAPSENTRHLIDSDFTTQAPTGNWSDPFSEACEEVSLLIAKSAVTGDLDAFADPVETENLIIDLVEKQKELLNGTWIDTDANLTRRVGEEILGLQIEIMENPTIDQIEAELLANHPIIVPTSGKELKNPFFSGEGPDYHMNVIVGFDRNNFIVQEPGTRRGENYKYNKDLLISAINDWNQVGNGLSGEKHVLVVKSAN